MSTRSRLMERPAGKGKVYHEGKFLCDVTYRLIVAQEILTDGKSDEALEGLHEITGYINGPQVADLIFLNQDIPFTLHLADGRYLDFVLQTQDGSVTGAGDFYK